MSDRETWVHRLDELSRTRTSAHRQLDDCDIEHTIQRSAAGVLLHFAVANRSVGAFKGRHASLPSTSRPSGNVQPSVATYLRRKEAGRLFTGGFQSKQRVCYGQRPKQSLTRIGTQTFNTVHTDFDMADMELEPRPQPVHEHGPRPGRGRGPCSSPAWRGELLRRDGDGAQPRRAQRDRWRAAHTCSARGRCAGRACC
jgi:hypothetical protein